MTRREPHGPVRIRSDVNLNHVGYQDTVTTYDGGLGNPSHRRPVTLSNTWNTVSATS